MSKITWTQGDTAPDQPFIIKTNGVAKNLTGCTVKFKFGPADTLAQVNAGHDTCTITSPLTGAVTYVVLAADTVTAGLFTGQVEVTDSNGKIQTTKSVDVEINQQVN